MMCDVLFVCGNDNGIEIVPSEIHTFTMKFMLFIWIKNVELFVLMIQISYEM